MATADLPQGPGQPRRHPRTLAAGAAGVLDVPAPLRFERMRPEARPNSLAAALLTIAIAGCGGSAATAKPSPADGGSGAPATSPTTVAAVTRVPTEAPTPTSVPGAASAMPPAATEVATTETDWGTILDSVPGSFPVFPGADAADVIEGPASGAWTTPAAVDDVAAWYRSALEALGLRTVALSDPLENGSRVLDSRGDLPECRVQTTFRPEGGSTMITVLYGAGCAGGDG
jgi:hypothetical protein